jgi:hypothetical protein
MEGEPHASIAAAKSHGFIAQETFFVMIFIAIGSEGFPRLQHSGANYSLPAKTGDGPSELRSLKNNRQGRQERQGNTKRRLEPRINADKRE